MTNDDDYVKFLKTLNKSEKWDFIWFVQNLRFKAMVRVLFH
jgi:hypothetical protein